MLEYWLCGDSPQPGLLYSTQYQTDFNSDTTGPLLYLAAEFGQERVVRMLLASGLDPNLPDSTGRTAVSAACQEGHLEVVRLLHSQGADIYQPDWEFGMGPVHYAADSGHLHILRYLHGQGVAMQTVCRYPDPNFDPEAPHHALPAHTLGMLSVVDILNDQSGILTDQTPLMIARHCGHDSVVEYLEDPFSAVGSQSLTLETEPSIKQRSSESLSVRAGRIGVTARLRCIPSDLSARVLSGTDDEKKKAQTEIRKIQKYNQQLISRAEQKVKNKK